MGERELKQLSFKDPGNYWTSRSNERRREQAPRDYFESDDEAGVNAEEDKLQELKILLDREETNLPEAKIYLDLIRELSDTKSVCLLGKNGIGKSTFLNVLLRYTAISASKYKQFKKPEPENAESNKPRTVEYLASEILRLSNFREACGVIEAREPDNCLPAGAADYLLPVGMSLAVTTNAIFSVRPERFMGLSLVFLTKIDLLKNLEDYVGYHRQKRLDSTSREKMVLIQKRFALMRLWTLLPRALAKLEKERVHHRRQLAESEAEVSQIVLAALAEAKPDDFFESLLTRLVPAPVMSLIEDKPQLITMPGKHFEQDRLKMRTLLYAIALDEPLAACLARVEIAFPTRLSVCLQDVPGIDDGNRLHAAATSMALETADMILLIGNGKDPEANMDLLSYFGNKLFDRWRKQECEVVWVSYPDKATQAEPSREAVAQQTEDANVLAEGAFREKFGEWLRGQVAGEELSRVTEALLKRILPLHRIHLKSFCRLAGTEVPEVRPAEWERDLRATGLPRLLGVIEQLYTVQEQLKNRQKIAALHGLVAQIRNRPDPIDELAASGLLDLLEHARSLYRDCRTEEQLSSFNHRYQLLFDTFSGPTSKYNQWKVRLITAFPQLLENWAVAYTEDERRLIEDRLEEKIEQFADKKIDPRAYLGHTDQGKAPELPLETIIFSDLRRFGQDLESQTQELTHELADRWCDVMRKFMRSFFPDFNQKARRRDTQSQEDQRPPDPKKQVFEKVWAEFRDTEYLGRIRLSLEERLLPGARKAEIRRLRVEAIADTLAELVAEVRSKENPIEAIIERLDLILHHFAVNFKKGLEEWWEDQVEKLTHGIVQWHVRTKRARSYRLPTELRLFLKFLGRYQPETTDRDLEAKVAELATSCGAILVTRQNEENRLLPEDVGFNFLTVYIIQPPMIAEPVRRSAIPEFPRDSPLLPFPIVTVGPGKEAHSLPPDCAYPTEARLQALNFRVIKQMPVGPRTLLYALAGCLWDSGLDNPELAEKHGAELLRARVLRGSLQDRSQAHLVECSIEDLEHRFAELDLNQPRLAYQLLHYFEFTYGFLYLISQNQVHCLGKGSRERGHFALAVETDETGRLLRCDPLLLHKVYFQSPPEPSKPSSTFQAMDAASRQRTKAIAAAGRKEHERRQLEGDQRCAFCRIALSTSKARRCQTCCQEFFCEGCLLGHGPSPPRSRPGAAPSPYPGPKAAPQPAPHLHPSKRPTPPTAVEAPASQRLRRTASLEYYEELGSTSPGCPHPPPPILDSLTPTLLAKARAAAQDTEAKRQKTGAADHPDHHPNPNPQRQPGSTAAGTLQSRPARGRCHEPNCKRPFPTLHCCGGIYYCSLQCRTLDHQHRATKCNRIRPIDLA